MGTFTVHPPNFGGGYLLMLTALLRLSGGGRRGAAGPLYPGNGRRAGIMRGMPQRGSEKLAV